MNKEKFVKQLNKDKGVFNRKRCKKIVKKSIDYSGEHESLIICMEELAELQQAISKNLRGQGESIDILEELADVLISIEYIKEIVNISDEELISAINVKINRLRRRLNAERDVFGWRPQYVEDDDWEWGGVLSKHEIDSLLTALDPNNPNNIDSLIEAHDNDLK